MVVEHNWRSTWTRPLREHRDSPLGGRCGETMELDGREPTIHTPLHLMQHPNVLHEKEQLWFKEYRNWVRRYNTTRQWGCTKSWTQRVRPKVGMIKCLFPLYDKMMSIYSRVCQRYTPRHSAHLRYPCITVHGVSLLADVLGDQDQASLVMHLEIEIEWSQRCTWRLGSSELGDTLGDQDRVNSEMYLEARMNRV